MPFKGLRSKFGCILCKECNASDTEWMNPYNLPPTRFPANWLTEIWIQNVKKFHTCCFIWYWITLNIIIVDMFASVCQYKIFEMGISVHTHSIMISENSLLKFVYGYAHIYHNSYNVNGVIASYNVCALKFILPYSWINYIFYI